MDNQQHNKMSGRAAIEIMETTVEKYQMYNTALHMFCKNWGSEMNSGSFRITPQGSHYET